MFVIAYQSRKLWEFICYVFRIKSNNISYLEMHSGIFSYFPGVTAISSIKRHRDYDKLRPSQYDPGLPIPRIYHYCN